MFHVGALRSNPGQPEERRPEKQAESSAIATETSSGFSVKGNGDDKSE